MLGSLGFRVGQPQFLELWLFIEDGSIPAPQRVTISCIAFKTGVPRVKPKDAHTRNLWQIVGP